MLISVLGILLMISLSVLLYYFRDFLQFIKEDNERRRINELNKTIDNILQYKKTDKEPIIIDIEDYRTNRDNFN
mgnify:CR=1 FL=1|tara:strand:+ start:1606 stop:1827 length:222 start_codon:yes stop_codon:yes gene_type:complete